MHSLRFTTETSSAGVVERDFTVGEVPGVLWSPVSGSKNAPLILLGHTGGLDKRTPGILARARRYVTDRGFTVAAIDAPGHGDRPRTAQDERARIAIPQARAAGEPIGPIIAEYNAALAERAVPDWQATLDALQALPEIGAEAPIGYGGTTLGTVIGLSLAAVEPRITAAVFGAPLVYEALTEAARLVTIPILFLLPWDDAEIDRRSGLALFDALASEEKTLHANPGGHHQIPRFEIEHEVGFYARHLGRPATSAA
ncbi:alpha/beta hydrolase [Actinomadura sp. DC4]|uniref:dienelactone hydrolase family protein n=1 Tax=Actinomadura sp. DC4 TaxID=3055069 RepID=UPI0025B03F61|nr:alpha/beta hydrolase [Actinomadura sp. DC4]MDN3354237.1 alpha/beta hydrolase [Actinomadura sp. DC4]